MRESAREKALRLKLEASQTRERRLKKRLQERPASQADKAAFAAGPFIDRGGREYWIRDGTFHFDRTAGLTQNDSHTSGYVHCPGLDGLPKPEWYVTTTPPTRYATLQGPEKAQSATHLALDVADLLEALADVVRHRG